MKLSASQFVTLASSLLTISMLIYFSQGIFINYKTLKDIREHDKKEQ